MKFGRSRLAALVALVLHAGGAWAAASFATSAGPPVGGNFGGGVGVTGVESADYGTHEDIYGIGTAMATSRVGHVGATASALSLGFSIVSGGAEAVYTDSVVFKGPSGQSTVSVAATLGLSGTLNATPEASASVNASYFMYGTLLFSLHEVVSGDTIGECTLQWATGLSGCLNAYTSVLVRSRDVLVPLDEEVQFQFRLGVGAGATGIGNSASSHFLNSLDYPTGVDVFVLPAGYTANSISGRIVNNRFVPLDPPSEVPEPSVLGLMIAGGWGAGLNLLARRRRRAARG